MPASQKGVEKVLVNKKYVDFRGKNELVVLSGVPGSGKSTLARKQFPNYRRINLDTLKTRKRENTEILVALERCENVVIDNTNVTKRSRRKYLDIARAFCIPARSVFLECPLEIALERNASRKGKERVPDKAVKFFYHELERPTKQEGFDSVEIICIPQDAQTRLDAVGP